MSGRSAWRQWQIVQVALGTAIVTSILLFLFVDFSQRPPGDPPNWGSVPDWVVAATAIFTAIMLFRQLRGLLQAEKSSTRQLELAAKQAEIAAQQATFNATTARSTLLLRLDQQYEGARLIRCRLLWIEQRGLAKASSGGDEPPFDFFLHWMNEARQNVDRGDGALHRTIHYLPAWMETVGNLCSNDAELLNIIENVYGTVIVEIMERVKPYALARTTNVSKPYANALKLAADIAQRKGIPFR
ncbi:hypothetical protein [Sandaracinobacteroides saxicola]|uniref:Uncharacterized protein n=1 Tax=Sandaracinobacteroides saxicola TaxID=2759707 RepID=A0A7G5IDT4_9SPHN|nr:hypothetical protein [Sandaracinobacteroides saxicola]QMW21526.1 hypothetical protein H3309_08815 [Sandaracinobacteroides saxicola]